MRPLLFVAAFICYWPIASEGQIQFPTGATAQQPEVVASGTAQVHVPPTYAILNVSITTRAPNAADAASLNAQQVARARAAILRAGIAADDVTTQGYFLEQAYEDNGRRRSGFTARNSLEVRINRIDQIGTVIDAAIVGGATEVSSIQYGAAGIDEARGAAMRDAVKKARADAALIAAAAGGSLGRLISITSNSGMPGIYDQVRLTAAMVGGTAGGPPTVISPRDLIANGFAQGRWEFLPGPAR